MVHQMFQLTINHNQIQHLAQLVQIFKVESTQIPKIYAYISSTIQMEANTMYYFSWNMANMPICHNVSKQLYECYRRSCAKSNSKKFSKANNMHHRSVPECLQDLTQAEENLIARFTYYVCIQKEWRTTRLQRSCTKSITRHTITTWQIASKCIKFAHALSQTYWGKWYLYRFHCSLGKSAHRITMVKSK